MPLSIDINSIVNQVLADLTVKPVDVPKVDEKELVVESRVLSLSELNGRIDSVKRIIVSPKTVITPSVRDVLRKRNIEIATKIPRLAATGRTSAIWFGVFPPGIASPKLLELIQKEYKTTPKTFDTLAELIDDAQRRLESIRGVALSNKSATVLCQANRREKIRAVQGFEPRQTQADTLELDANLLVVDPVRLGEFRTLEVVKAYHTVPSPFGRRLG